MTEGPRLQDRFGRRINYLRLSITDRCNLSCTYCRPREDSTTREDILSFEEIFRFIKVAVGMGIDKVRITGGEPLVRKNAVGLVEMLSGVRGIKELTLSTNALLLKKYARDLAAAGLQRVNISLDTLKPERFKKFTGGTLGPVIEGIDAAIDAGLTPVKLNTVAMRGFNDDEIPEIIDFASARSLTLRFIELMPMSWKGVDWESHYISVDEMLKLPGVKERVDTETSREDGPGVRTAAAFYRPLRSAGGDVGFISPMSERFCNGCNRLRLTSDGRLRSCLPTDSEVSIRKALRNSSDRAPLAALIEEAVLLKPEQGEYKFNDEELKAGCIASRRSMTEIGG